MSIFKTILDIILAFLGIVPKAPDERDKERDAGVTSGRAQERAGNAEAGIRELDTADKARDAAAADLAAHPDRVRAPDGDMAPRDPSGIS